MHAGAMPFSHASDFRCYDTPTDMKRGNWIVLTIIGIGLLASAAALGYRSLVVRNTKKAINASPAAVKTPAWDQADAAEQLMMIQEQYLKAGETADLTAIAAAAKNLTEQYPQFAGAFTLLAQVSVDANQYDVARAALKQSLALNNKQAEVHLLAGNLALMDGDIDGAESHTKTAVALKPDEARYRLHLANIHFERGRPEQARNIYLDALRLDSSLHQAYGGLADIYASQNQLQVALTNIQKAIDHAGGDTQKAARRAYTRKKASLLRRDNRPDEALMTLEGLSVREKLDPDILEEIAIAWAQLGKPAHAATLYEEALATNPVHWRYAAGAAKWHIKAGKPEAARPHLLLLRKLDPNLPAIEEIEKQLESK